MKLYVYAGSTIDAYQVARTTLRETPWHVTSAPREVPRGESPGWDGVDTASPGGVFEFDTDRPAG